MRRLRSLQRFRHREKLREGCRVIESRFLWISGLINFKINKHGCSHLLDNRLQRRVLMSFQRQLISMFKFVEISILNLLE